MLNVVEQVTKKQHKFCRISVQYYELMKFAIESTKILEINNKLKSEFKKILMSTPKSINQAEVNCQIQIENRIYSGVDKIIRYLNNIGESAVASELASKMQAMPSKAMAVESGYRNFKCAHSGIELTVAFNKQNKVWENPEIMPSGTKKDNNKATFMPSFSLHNSKQASLITLASIQKQATIPAIAVSVEQTNKYSDADAVVIGKPRTDALSKLAIINSKKSLPKLVDITPEEDETHHLPSRWRQS